MNMLQALIVVLVLIATLMAIKYILGHKTKPTGPCVSAVANIVLPAGGAATPIACCQDENGQCIDGYSSTYGSVTLVPTTISAACPPQALAQAQYSPYLSNPAGNAPGTADVSAMASLYTAGTGCGDIQVALTRLCAATGDTPAACKGGIAVARGATSQTVSCPGGAIQPTRRLIIPGDFSKTTCKGGSSGCCFTDLAVGGPVPSVALNQAADSSPTPCAGQPLDEILFYQCVTAGS